MNVNVLSRVSSLKKRSTFVFAPSSISLLVAQVKDANSNVVGLRQTSKAGVTFSTIWSTRAAAVISSGYQRNFAAL